MFCQQHLINPFNEVVSLVLGDPGGQFDLVIVRHHPRVLLGQREGTLDLPVDVENRLTLGSLVRFDVVGLDFIDGEHRIG
ncbi:hypothetical protein [Mycobacterium sp.]|uniref:hypothetical protein n=1 Tax=Mycobacterium sp. TaxID=1785 RepID=UPI003BABF5ED